MKSRIFELSHRNRELRMAILVSALLLMVVFMANLSALVDLKFNPHVSYFDEEHLIVGGVSALLTLLLFGVLAVHAGLLEKALTRHQQDVGALKASEKKFRNLFEQSKDAVFIKTPQGRFKDVNPAGIGMLGYDSLEEMLELDIPRDVHVDYRDWLSLMEMMEAKGFVENHQVRLKKKNGEEITVLETATSEKDDSGRLVGCSGTMRDVTSQQQMEDELNHMRRMESIGRLAGGVAHDFNNHLTTISGRAEMALGGLPADSQMRENIREIIDTVDKASCLTRQLLLFSRSQPLSLQPVQLNATLSGIRFTLNRIFGDDARISLRLGEDVAAVDADAANLELVIMNLALHAVETGSRGEELTISTSNILIDDSYALNHAEAYSGKFALIEIVHSGYSGEGQQPGYLFEPFRGAGPNGRNGMGLAVAHGIVVQHGGWIEFEGRRGDGCTYRIYLPAGSSAAGNAAAGRSPGSDAGRGETILLVEDEDAVRQTLAKMLQLNGYLVTSAASADEAFDLFVSQAGDVQLLFSDVSLVGRSGVDLAGHLRSHKPGLPVILCSGFTDSEEDLQAIRDHDYRFLQKPFSLPDLLKAVREALGQHTEYVAIN